MADFQYATFEDVKSGYEKAIPASLEGAINTFLSRASTRLEVLIKIQTKVDLRARFVAEADGSTLKNFVRDLVADSAERKFRNPAGFSHENAGIFSVSRWEDFARGRIDFDQKDLDLIAGLIESDANETILGPITTSVPAHRRVRFC
jgi:hypothetical protein